MRAISGTMTNYCRRSMPEDGEYRQMCFSQYVKITKGAKTEVGCATNLEKDQYSLGGKYFTPGEPPE